jgi:uncharacterized damage-inducible protein DinB
MNKQTAEGMFGYFRMVLGVTRKIVDQFPADKMNYKPTEAQRTVAETVAHMYSFLLITMETIRDGKTPEMTEPKFNSKAELLAYMDNSLEKANKLFEGITDEQLARMIDAWGMNFPAWQMLTFMNDEHWHHRGALTVYLRLCGIEPIMIYSY